MGRLFGGGAMVLSLGAAVLATISGCSSTAAPATGAIGRPTTSTSAQPPCPPNETEALQLAAQYNSGVLPSDASINTGGMICDSGWAEGALQSPSVGDAMAVYRVVNGAWQMFTMGTDICFSPQDEQRMSIAPASIRHAVNC